MQEQAQQELEDFLFELQQSSAFEDVFTDELNELRSETHSDNLGLNLDIQSSLTDQSVVDPQDLLTSSFEEHTPTGKRDPPEGVLIPVVYTSDFLSGNSIVEDEYILDPSSEAQSEAERQAQSEHSFTASDGREYTELDLVYWDTEWSKL